MSQTARRLIGREDELAAIARLLDAREELPGAVVLHGEAGIGKTSVWLAGLDAARASGFRTLVARPSEAETGFSYAGLADLVGDAAPRLAELPPIQRRALEAALLLGDSDAVVDDRVVAAAYLATLRLLASDGPLCLAVDDVQWLDRSSLTALTFAMSRLRDEPVALLFTVRGQPPSSLRRALPEARVTWAELNGMSVGALHELLRTQLDTTFPRPMLIRLWETSGGSPFFALELGRALLQHGSALAPGDPFPIPSSLDGLLRARLDALGDGGRAVARVVAAAADPTTDLVEATLGDSADAGIEEALAARIVELGGDRLRFTHPLLASAVIARESPGQRRMLHRRLAGTVSTAEERARHLALATNAPDRAIAATIEEAARSAHARGAPATAAELAEQALRLTPPSDTADARRRVFLAADRHHAAGDTGRAVAMLRDALAASRPGTPRGEVLVQLADVLFESEPRESARLNEEALLEVEGNDALEASIQIRLADAMRWGAGIAQGVIHATLGVEAASRTDDVALRCCAIATRADWRFRAGEGVQRAEMDEAIALERRLPGWPLVGGPLEYLCHQLVWAFELDEARRLNLELVAMRQARNDPSNEAWALWNLGLLEWRAGNWAEAERHAADSVDLRTQLGRVSHTHEFPSAIIAAHTGRVDDAREWSHRAIARGTLERVQIEESGHSWVLGFVELSLGDAASALPYLRRSYEVRNSFMLEPAQRIELGDLLEALVATGALEEADAVLAEWEPRAAALDRAWALALLARGRGLLLAARGDFDGAFAAFDRALAEHARSVDPFHHARTLLALGKAQRRARKRAAARATLEEALARFETLGAPLWAEQTRAELGRIGGRTSSSELTEAETRIAALVAEGRTNREVAAALFLTEHSVETALTRVYRKLGVRSRVELAHQLAADS